MYKTIEIRQDNEIEWLYLNRPEKLNAINPEMCEELQHYFHHLTKRTEVRVVIFSGKGNSFCAGYDLREATNITKGGPVKGIKFQRQVSEILLRMRRCPQPVICLAHGAATGGGLAFMLASDVRILAENAKMNVAMAKIGLTGCDVGISYFLPRAVGHTIAAELMMTGRMISAKRAIEINLASEVVELSNLESAGKKMVEDMLRVSPMGLRFTKEGLNMSLDSGSLENVIALEDRGQILCASAGYFEEGISAFLEKRNPNYSE